MDLQLHEYMTTVGNRSQDKLVKARSKTEMTVSGVSDLQKPLKAAFKLIKGEADWPYRMKSFMGMEPALDVVGELEIDAVKTGTVTVLQQLKKLR